MATVSDTDPAESGVYPKFVIRRAYPDAQARHRTCFVFALDPACDPHAAAAVAAYADSCEQEQPVLAGDLRAFAAIPLQTKINAISAWVDHGLAGKDPETVLWHRVAKIAEEHGEATEALIGYTCGNPRKQGSHSIEDLRRELLDVAVAALAAHAHTQGNEANSVAALAAHTDHVYRRAGLDGEGGDGRGPR